MKTKLTIALCGAAAVLIYAACTSEASDEKIKELTAVTPAANYGGFESQVKWGEHLVTICGCNDCHTPPGLVAKYATKARNGFWHSYYFTTGWFEDNIHITQRGAEVAEQACRKCHQEIVQAIEGPHPEAKDAQTSCIRCHDSVGHLH